VNSTQLETTWSELPTTSTNQLSGLRVPGLRTHRVYIAVDGARRRQLLVAIPKEAEPLIQYGMRGLAVFTDELQIGNSAPDRYIQLVCVNPLHHTTFTGLCADIVTAIQADPENARVAVAQCLERWRSFWTVDAAGLSREEALGLFGELWFLHRWLDAAQLTTMQTWTGPTGARHDFQCPTHSIEVKTAITGAHQAPMHFITSLEQLDDPETGELFLFSLQLADDVLAKNTLPALIEQITTSVQAHPDNLDLFNQRLALTGYNPSEADRYARPLRITGENLYRVSGRQHPHRR
jgi:hypothetical protein